MKRIFIAVKIVPQQKLTEVLSSLKHLLANEPVKWTDLSNIHLTIEFLGDTEDDKITVLSSMLKEKCSGTLSCLTNHNPFPLSTVPTV